MRSKLALPLLLASSVAGIALALLACQHFGLFGQPALDPTPKVLASGIRVSSQVQLKRLHDLEAEGFATVIDMRPDGEAADQPASAEVERAAHALGLQFHYIPVPHGDIPEQAVVALEEALTHAPSPVLLYCRSGRRAVRTWSLYEASRVGGLGSPQILATAKAAGQAVDDLAPLIAQRIAARQPVQARAQ